MTKNLNTKYEKKAKIFIVMALSLIAYVIYFWFFVLDRPPQFFPLNNINETYTINKDVGIYGLKYSGKSDYGITSATIAKSPKELESLAGKKVAVSGRFDRSTTQCIAKVCKDIGGSFVGLYIDNIVAIGDLVSQAPRDKIITYTVVEDDRIDTISQKFNISKDTIMWENNLKDDILEEGKILRILPVTGVSHIVIEGDTLGSLARKYKTNKQKIIDYPFNDYADPESFTLIPGTIIIIPDGAR